MKKIIIILAILAFPIFAAAQGSVVITYDSPVSDLDFIRVIATCTGDAGTGAFPITVFPEKVVELVSGMWLFEVVTIPGPDGGVDPTALWDARILQTRYGETYDVCGGALLDRAANTAEVAAPKIGVFAGSKLNLGDAWEVDITGNSVASAEIIIEMHFIP